MANASFPEWLLWASSLSSTLQASDIHLIAVQSSSQNSAAPLHSGAPFQHPSSNSAINDFLMLPRSKGLRPALSGHTQPKFEYECIFIDLEAHRPDEVVVEMKPMASDLRPFPLTPASPMYRTRRPCAASMDNHFTTTSTWGVATGVLPSTFPVILDHGGASVIHCIPPNYKGSELQGRDAVLRGASSAFAPRPTCGPSKFSAPRWSASGSTSFYMGGSSKKVRTDVFMQCLMSEYAMLPAEILPVEYADTKSTTSTCIIELGGMGFASLAGATPCNFDTVIIFNLVDDRIALAQKHSTTHTISIRQADEVVKEIKALTLGSAGVQCVFEATSVPRLTAVLKGETTSPSLTPCIVTFFTSRHFDFITDIAKTYKPSEMEQALAGRHAYKKIKP
ncbi:hypothetical protein K437DRAFT_296898 [Tilletiaria anomala UBC 951]|uniref:Uncharacterized protein n=1 Tax=Tilletiaria anomala (strain ATCC 24038 / CBS 436.72 / UBC 951) TaxID=1037660 RepID=A0A066V2E6_TILAU|nr:uncharacterized protein K437DRAFT_296898 [Tilletiaria anomala UBC 951]KDN35857.1 hypothetical protein K437DRAFT_296898 [Tilletiaria anomala UBC 951]